LASVAKVRRLDVEVPGRFDVLVNNADVGWSVRTVAGETANSGASCRMVRLVR
jgi:hypothetical protein